MSTGRPHEMDDVYVYINTFVFVTVLIDLALYGLGMLSFEATLLYLVGLYIVMYGGMR